MALGLQFLPILTTLMAQEPNSRSRSAAAQPMNAVDQASLAKALAAYDQGRGQEAEGVLADLAQRYPKSFEAVETLGLIWAEGGDVSSALPLLEKACRLRPRSALAAGNVGAAYLKLSRNQEAVRALRRSVTLDSRNFQSLSGLGQALLLSGDAREAAAAFANAAAIDNSDPDLRYNWALALFDAGNTRDADHVLAAVRGKDSLPQVQSLLGDIAERQGQYKAAAEHFRAAATLDPSESNIYALGLEFMRHWTFPEAIKIFEYGISRFPASARLQLGLGVSKYGNNDFSGAAPVFSGLLEKDPDNAVYADLLGQSCSFVAEGQSSACQELESFAEQHPQNAKAATFAASSILRRPQGEQNLPLARHLLEAAIAGDPTLAEAYFQMGVLDQKQLEWQASAGMLEKAVALRPKYSQAHYRLARAYAHMGKSEQAQQEFELQRRYSQEEKDSLSTKLKAVTTFLVTLQ